MARAQAGQLVAEALDLLVEEVRPGVTTGALDASEPPLYRWFPDGTLNTSYNALDRHVEAGRGGDAALIDVVRAAVLATGVPEVRLGIADGRVTLAGFLIAELLPAF